MAEPVAAELRQRFARGSDHTEDFYSQCAARKRRPIVENGVVAVEQIVQSSEGIDRAAVFFSAIDRGERPIRV